MDFTKVTNFMNALDELGVPGADLAIYLKGKEVYRHHVGYADIETKTPITRDTLYAIFSMTKVITCVAALRLFEEGRYLLTDPLHAYMPEFKDLTIRYYRENGDFVKKPAVNPIRIVDLFTMSSGYPYFPPGAAISFEATEGNYTLQQMVTKLATEPINFEPGTRWCYGFSHDILGRLIEILSGKTFGQFLSEQIFKPLGMSDTGFKISKEKHHRLASIYTYDESSKQNIRIMTGIPFSYFNAGSSLYLCDDWLLESPGGGLISSVDDYAKFANALCLGGTSENGYRLLGEATIELMATNHLDDAKMKDFSGGSGKHGSYGYGLGVRTLIDKVPHGLSSSYGEFGWSGLAGTYVAMDPIKELTYVYAHQLHPNKENYIQPRLKNIIYGCL